MSITVVKNPNGTVTVSCGGDSVVVGTPSGGPTGAGGTSPYPNVTPSGGGVTAYMLAHRPKATVKTRDRATAAQIAAALRAGIKTARKSHSPEAPLILRFGVRSGKPLDLSKVCETLREVDEKTGLACEIFFADKEP
jgi:hypothetical protein